MKSRKLLLSLAVFFLVGAFVPTKASSVIYSEGEGEDNQPEARGWVSIGPNNVAGRVRAIMFDKYNDGVMYAASVGGGLYVSVNNGANWKEIDFSNGECYAATALAQGDDGAIYVGTGEGYYSDIFSGQNNRKSGLPGNGVYKVSFGVQNWAAGLASDADKYNYISTNSQSTLISGTQPAKYDFTHEFCYVNDLAFVAGKLLIATKNGGLKVWDGSNLSSVSIDGSSTVNVTDVKVNRDNKVALVYNAGTTYKVALSNAAFTQEGSTPAFTSILAPQGEEAFGRIELAFGRKNNNMLYALVSNALYANLQGVYKADVNAENVTFGPKMTSNNLYIGSSMDEAMSIAVNDLEEEYIYIGDEILQRLFDANSSDVFYAEQQTSTSAGRTSGMFVAPGIHAILFKENPQTAADSLAIYLATDAGVYVYGQDATQMYSWQPSNKGLKSSQYYNVAAAADGSVMGAAQSNAITYIANPSLDTEKSADIVWSPNNPGYTSYVIQTDRDGVDYSFTMESQTGSNVASSAIHRTKPNVRKPYILMRANNGLTRTYSDNDDYNEVNDQTWHFGNGEAMLMNPQMATDMGAAPFVAPMVYWESFNAPEAIRDTVSLQFVVTSNDLSIGATRIIRGDEVIRFVAGTELKDGDKVLVESNSLDYPFLYTLTAERFGTTPEGNLDFAPMGDTTILVPSPVKSRLFVATSNGVYACDEIMNFSKTYYRGATGLPWARVFNVNGGSGTAQDLYRNPVHAMAASADGNSLLLSVDHLQSGVTELLRVSGLATDTVDLGNVATGGFTGSFTDPNKFRLDTLATFNRTISSIAYEANSDVAFITFSGYNPSEVNVKKVSGLLGDAASVQFEDIALPASDGSDVKPVHSILLDAFSNKAYIGADDGLYEAANRNASSITWNKVNDFPSVPVYDLYQQTANLPYFEYVSYLNNNATENAFEGTKYVGAIYAATYGKGLFMYRDELQSPMDTVSVGLADVPAQAVAQMNLYPNPAANNTVLNYSLAVSSKVVMNIFDMNGRLVSSLDKGMQSAGSHSQIIDLRSMEKGVYMIQIVTNGAVKTAKLIVQ
ncbi:MAG: T9SS type A sorting domain-containing protein [Candidatus Onthomorpha sp.]